MNAILFRNIIRSKPAPAIVPYIIDAFDRCDPTRSHEQKPSARLQTARRERRLVLSVTACLFALCVLAAVLTS